MKEALTRKIFGKIPVWMLLLVVMLVAYLWWRKRAAKSKGITGDGTENPAAGAEGDPTSPFGYSSPDMFPLQGAQGPTGPVGPAGPTGSASGTATGMTAGAGARPLVASRQSMLAYLRAKYPKMGAKWYTTEASRRLTIERKAASVYDTRIGNTPAYNTPIGVPNTL